ncbi:MAG TPA: hypothetical protein VLS88_02305 [Polyangiales bacterium]|jgi:hypothetical protein|nr:hypothetical protein [Polyangiales bacterium]
MRKVLFLVAVSTAFAFAVVGCESGSGTSGATFSISGNAFSFAPPGFPGWGRIEGGTVSVLEMPERTTTTVEDGYFILEDLPVNEEITLVLEAEGFPTTHTKTFTLTDSDIEEVTFQVPNLDLYDALALVLGATLSPDKCQLVSTVTFLGGSLYLPNAHGEAGATVAIDPPDENADGPIYFNEDVIPDRSWSETSSDGGIVFVNTEPGDYILSATKDGVVFESVKLKCRAGVLANASPPHALQVIEYLE